MAQDDADNAASSQALSDTVAQHFAADICALQHRLYRCLVQAQAVVEALHGTQAQGSGRHATVSIRRLGDLLRTERQLEARIAGKAHSLSTAVQPVVVKGADTEAEGSSTDGSLRAFYRQQLQSRLAHLQKDADAAQRLLSAYLCETPELAHLPVSCIGTAPRTLEGGAAPTSTAVRHSHHVYTEVMASDAAHISPPVTHVVAGQHGEQRVTDTGRNNTPSSLPGKQEQRGGATASAPVSVPRMESTTAASAAPAPTAEDRIMADIQQAIHQMKDGALQMGALMANEKSQMHSAAELLSGGVAKSQANMKELDRVADVAAQARVPWVLARVPGMPIVWRTVLQPMWAFLKQVLLMAAVLAVTGAVLLVISVLPKPTLYRGIPHIHAAAEPHVAPLPPARQPVGAKEAPVVTTASPTPAVTVASAAPPAASVKQQAPPQQPTGRTSSAAEAEPESVGANMTEEVKNRTPGPAPVLPGVESDDTDVEGDL